MVYNMSKDVIKSLHTLFLDKFDWQSSQDIYRNSMAGIEYIGWFLGDGICNKENNNSWGTDINKRWGVTL